MTSGKIEHAVLLDGQAYRKRADGTLVPMKGKTDWSRVEAMSDEDIEQAIADDPDATPLLDQSWFERAEKALTARKQSVHIRLDSEIVDYFKSSGTRGYQTRINAVLARYVRTAKSISGDGQPSTGTLARAGKSPARKKASAKKAAASKTAVRKTAKKK